MQGKFFKKGFVVGSASDPALVLNHPTLLYSLSNILLSDWDYLLMFIVPQVDPLVYNMSHEDPGNISYSEIGGK